MATNDATPPRKNADGKRVHSPPKDNDQSGIPKVRIIDRLLMQDANRDEKVDHMEGQLRNFEEFARSVTQWMTRTEDGYRNDTDRLGENLRAMAARLDALETKPEQLPPGLEPDLAEKVKKLEESDKKVEGVILELQIVAGGADVLRNDLTELAARLDGYTKNLEAQTAATNDQISSCFKDLSKLEVDTLENVHNLERSQEQHRAGYKETVNGIIGDIRRLQANAGRRGEATGAGGPSAPAPSAPGDGSDDGDGGKPFHAHIGSDDEHECHCVHVAKLIEDVEAIRAEILGIREDANGQHQRMSTTINGMEDLRKRMEDGLQANEHVQGLIARLEESGGDPWAYWGGKGNGGRTEPGKDAFEIPRRDSPGAPLQGSGSATPWGSIGACGAPRPG